MGLNTVDSVASMAYQLTQVLKLPIKKGESWNVFQTKAMPTNILIEKGGKIVSIAAGCDPSGLLAKKLSEKIAKTVQTEAVDVKAKVDQNKKEKK